MNVNFTYDELHAFSEHVTWVIMEQDQPVNEHLQSFIDKVLYPDNSPYSQIPERYKTSYISGTRPVELWYECHYYNNISNSQTNANTNITNKLNFLTSLC